MITAQTHQSEQTGTANTPLQGRPIRTFVIRKGRITEAQKKAYTDYAPSGHHRNRVRHGSCNS